MSTSETENEKWFSSDVTANGIRFHYTRTDGNKSPLVLAHGFSDDGLCWTPVAQILESDFDVVMVDARGHGHSEAPEDGYNSVQMAHDLAGVIFALGLESPVILGHSMGAATALNLAGLYPQLPRAILLEDPPSWWKAATQPVEPEKPANNDWQKNTRAWIEGLQNQSREELIEKQKRATPSWSDLEIELWADAHLRLSLNVVNGPNIRGLWDSSLMERIACPTLLITANPDQGAIVTESDAQLLKNIIPHLKIAHIPGAGHSIHREQFELFMCEVQAFLRGLE
ncbi:N-formylmaleamate deformylase [Abditibacteriota bacterium]|nr:N-formylmaleamate deformylase [Abditibacteriota bacterium]